jgi:hypothetical protein
VKVNVCDWSGVSEVAEDDCAVLVVAQLPDLAGADAIDRRQP